MIPSVFNRSRTLALAVAVAAIALPLLGAARADALKPGRGTGVAAKRIGTFSEPLFITSAPGVRGIFVVERGGRIRHYRKGRKRKFLDIRDLVRDAGTEEGLLSVAFAPDYRRSRRFYVYYVDNSGNLAIAEFRARAGLRRGIRSTQRKLLTIPHPGHTNHNGGALHFGPDGLLYAGIGDGGGAGDDDDSAQNRNSLLGKILRINPTAGGGAPYGIPGDNPFAGPVPGRGEIFSLGLRNPYRFSFDRVTASGARIAIGDVGQNAFEEIDYETLPVASGANFGWNDYEAFSLFPGRIPPTASGTQFPIKAYSLAGGRCAVIGGYVVRNRRLRRLFKRYVYGDFCGGQVRSFVPSLGGARRDKPTGVNIPMLSSLGEGRGGTLYATSLEGPIYRFVKRR